MVTYIQLTCVILTREMLVQQRLGSKCWISTKLFQCQNFKTYFKRTHEFICFFFIWSFEVNSFILFCFLSAVCFQIQNNCKLICNSFSRNIKEFLLCVSIFHIVCLQNLLISISFKSLIHFCVFSRDSDLTSTNVSLSVCLSVSPWLINM